MTYAVVYQILVQTQTVTTICQLVCVPRHLVSRLKATASVSLFLPDRINVSLRMARVLNYIDKQIYSTPEGGAVWVLLRIL